MKNTIYPHKFWRPFWTACLSLIFSPQYVWFPAYLYIGLIPISSGQLAEIIVSIIPQEYICIVTKSYCPFASMGDHNTRNATGLLWVFFFL